MARDTPHLSPGLAARMSIGADNAAAQPAMVGTIRLGTEVRVRIDRPPTSSGEADDRRGRAWRFGAGIGPLLTGLAQRFVDESGEGLGFCGAVASAQMGVGAFWAYGALR